MRLTFALFALLPEWQVWGGDGRAGTHGPRLSHCDSNKGLSYKLNGHSGVL